MKSQIRINTINQFKIDFWKAGVRTHRPQILKIYLIGTNQL